MKVFYDTEFIEDGHTIDLISIGMVAEDGREYYAISSEFSHPALLANPWLIGNVLPSLPFSRGSATASALNVDYDHPDRPAIRARWRIRQEITSFLLGTESSTPLELWAWYGAYDHVALAQLFGRMTDLAEGIPMWTNDLKQEVVRLGNPRLPERQDDGVHNALADARHVKAMYDHVHTLSARLGLDGASS